VREHLSCHDLRRIRNKLRELSSCVHSAAIRFEALAWLEVSNRLVERTTPSPASIRK